MRAVGLKVLKNRLSEYVRLAASGETVLVTDRDRVVAELVPPGCGSQSDAVGRVAGRRGPAGLAAAARAGGDGRAPRQPVAKLATILRDLQADRDER